MYRYFQGLGISSGGTEGFISRKSNRIYWIRIFEKINSLETDFVESLGIVFQTAGLADVVFNIFDIKETNSITFPHFLKGKTKYSPLF